MSALTPDQLAELRAIAEAATPESWEWDEPLPLNHLDGDWENSAPWLQSADLGKPILTGEICGEPENARHIAAFDPPTVLALLDRIAALEAASRRP